MPKKSFPKRNIVRWTAIGLIFCVAVGFAFVVLADGACDGAPEMPMPQTVHDDLEKPVQGFTGLRPAGGRFNVVVVMHCAAAPSCP